MTLNSIAVMAGTLRQMIARRRSSGVSEYVATMKNVNLESVSKKYHCTNYLKVPNFYVILLYSI